MPPPRGDAARNRGDLPKAVPANPFCHDGGGGGAEALRQLPSRALLRRGHGRAAVRLPRGGTPPHGGTHPRTGGRRAGGDAAPRRPLRAEEDSAAIRGHRDAGVQPVQVLEQPVRLAGGHKAPQGEGAARPLHRQVRRIRDGRGLQPHPVGLRGLHGRPSASGEDRPHQGRGGVRGAFKRSVVAGVVLQGSRRVDIGVHRPRERVPDHL